MYQRPLWKHAPGGVVGMGDVVVHGMVVRAGRPRTAPAVTSSVVNVSDSMMILAGRLLVLLKQSTMISVQYITRYHSPYLVMVLSDYISVHMNTRE